MSTGGLPVVVLSRRSSLPSWWQSFQLRHSCHSQAAAVAAAALNDRTTYTCATLMRVLLLSFKSRDYHENVMCGGKCLLSEFPLFIMWSQTDGVGLETLSRSLYTRRSDGQGLSPFYCFLEMQRGFLEMRRGCLEATAHGIETDHEPSGNSHL